VSSLEIDITEAVDAAAKQVYESYGTMKFDDLDAVTQLHARELVLPSIAAATPKIIASTLASLRLLPPFQHGGAQQFLSDAIAQLEGS
jgi:hypothetical protein